MDGVLGVCVCVLSKVSSSRPGVRTVLITIIHLFVLV